MNLSIQAAEIARIAEMLAPMCDSDEVLFHDMMTAESPIDRVISRIHETIARDGEMLAGIKERKDALAEREQRLKSRVATGKSAIGQLLRAASLPKLELPEITYSVRDGKPGLQVISDDAVPDGFCTFKRMPDKRAINEAYEGADNLPNWLVRTPAKDVVTGRAR